MSDDRPNLSLVSDALPPQNLEAEQAVLGSLLLGKRVTAREVVHLLAPSDFYREAHQRIYEAALALLDEEEPLDMTSVGARLRARGELDQVGGLDYLDRLVRSTPYVQNALTYAKVVAAMSAKRALLWAGQRVLQVAYALDLNTTDSHAAAYAAVSEAIAAHVQGPDTRYTGDPAVEHWRELRARADEPIRTGFATLDEALQGGWQRHQVHVLTAATSMGKSMLALHFVLAAINQGRKCGLASLEMPLAECLERLLAISTGVPYSLVRRGLEWLEQQTRFDGRAVAAQLEREARRLMRGLVVDEASGYDVAEMSRRLRRLREEDGCELLLLDHFGNVAARGHDQTERLAAVDQELQRLAHPAVLGAPLLVVAQQNREGAAESSLERIFGCYRLVQHSPVVLSFERERNADPGQAVVQGKLRVLKNRSGVGGVVVALEGNPQTFRWTEVGRDADVSNEFDDDPFAE